MRIFINEKYIDRNKKISKITMISSLVFLGFSFIAMLNTTANSVLFFPALIAGVIGIILSTINTPLANRFGNSPRPDELITASLKGLGDEFSLFHYSTDIPHLLLGPNGLWILMPYQVKGKVIYDQTRKKWKLIKKSGLLVRIFGSEGIGNPTKEAQYLTQDLQQGLSKKFTNQDLPRPTPLAIFLSTPIELEVEGSPFPAIASDKIKNFLRRAPDLPKPQQSGIERLRNQLSS